MPLNTRLFSQTLTIEEFVSVDGYNVPSYGTIHTVKVREETDLNYLRENFRELKITDTVLYVLSPNYEPKYNDKVNLLNGDSFPIKNVKHMRNDVGDIWFYTIVIGK